MKLLRRLKNIFIDSVCSVLLFLKFDILFRYLGADYRQVVICGIPRSGTSLLFNLFNSALIDLDVYVKQNKKNKKSRETSGLRALVKPGNFITKLPNDLFNLEKFERRNIFGKKILIVVLTRDFRDVLTSRHQWGDGDYYLSFNMKKTLKNRLQRNRGLKNYIREIQKLKDQRFENIDICFKDYRNLMESPDSVIDELDRYGFKNKGYGYWKDFKSVYGKGEKSSQRLKKIEARWKDREHRDRIIRQFTENPELFDLLEEFGYEKDHTWFDDFKKKKEFQS